DLFVYGTLMSGHVRWRFLEHFVAEGPEPVTVPGRLFDTGLDFPAARFDLDGMVHGQWFRLMPDRVDDALARLDEVEGAASGYYRRVVVTSDDGRRAWAYEFGGSTDDLIDLDGRWTGA